jgi:ubiquinone/menaquinone biosynthesis C-methylase UbiE
LTARAGTNAVGAQPRDYLRVDAFMRTLVDARALKTAFETRLIDRLIGVPSVGVDALRSDLKLDRPGLELLLDMLAASRVVTRDGDAVALASDFRAALDYRDLLEAKLDFAGFLAADFLEGFTLLLADPEAFKKQSRLFELFDYRRCFEQGVDNYERTKTWMRLTTMLTKYESRACLELHDFSRYRRVLDVGGNSGEFVLRLCKAHAELRATVMDLPLVCEIGLEHILSEPERSRIAFLKGDVRKDALPAGFDLIGFKSMLHDWPEAEAKRLLARAAEALAPGGSILVFERGPMRFDGKAIPFSLLPTLLFFRSYREPSVYTQQLEALGLRDVQTRTVQLDTPFFLVTARKVSA